MRLPWPALAICIGLVASSTGLAEVPKKLRLLIARSRVPQALEMLGPLLDASPDDPELHGVYGSLMTQAGWHGDAVTAFGFADGSEWYAKNGMRQHANSLRAIGHVEEAVRVRELSRLNPRRDEASDVATFRELVNDYTEGRLWEEGELVVDELIGMSPEIPKSWATATWFHTARGDFDAAYWCAWQAERLGDPFESKVARANLYMEMGDLDAATVVLGDALRRRARHLVAGAVKAELARRKGNPVEAIEITHHKRYNETTHIDLRSVEVRALIDLHRFDEAADVLDVLGAQYERNPKYVDLAEELARAQAAAP